MCSMFILGFIHLHGISIKIFYYFFNYFDNSLKSVLVGKDVRSLWNVCWDTLTILSTCHWWHRWHPAPAPPWHTLCPVCQQWCRCSNTGQSSTLPCNLLGRQLYFIWNNITNLGPICPASETKWFLNKTDKITEWWSKL